MILTEQQHEALIFGQKLDGFEVVDDGNWICSGAYDRKEVIFKKDGKFWSVSEDRSGSYYTDYNYGSEYDKGPLKATEVEKVKVVTYIWEAVKNNE